MTALAQPWTGRWVCDRLGIDVETTESPVGLDIGDLVGLAVRRNPRRAHLLVSTVLGKHVPRDPRIVYGAALLLGELVRLRLTGAAVSPTLGEGLRRALKGEDLAGLRPTPRVAAPPCPPTVVLGYAETATALGHAVADAVAAVTYLHSTRRVVPGIEPFGGFDEEHSHATRHHLLPMDATSLSDARLPLVLVDDELSTGRTALNTIRELHRSVPRERYVIAALVDLRSTVDRRDFDRTASELGATIDVVSLASGRVSLPEGVLARGAALADAVVVPPALAVKAGSVVRVDAGWPTGLPEGGRHGVSAEERAAFDGAVAAATERIVVAMPHDVSDVVVLGCEELMYAPLRMACALADTVPGVRVRTSSTTRSPVVPVDEEGYAIRTALAFPAHDGAEGERYAYNLTPVDAIVLVTDERMDTAELAGLVGALRGVADTVLHVVLPGQAPEPLRGPDFGSYEPADVGWLLTDLSHARLEAPTEEREEAIQSSGAHYAESLPIEYQPSAEYLDVFRAALTSSAERVARAVGVVTEILLAERGRDLVLASLARAGTPVGVLVRRWASFAHGIDLPHYAVSIVRGRGIDEVALSYLGAHHDPGAVVFLDGWTGKGAIMRELSAALESLPHKGFRADLAVLADPGGCASTFGTREDFLIPSACLNSTVSGLVSRTVLNTTHLRPGQFHGAKFYAELASADVSHEFLDAVTAQFSVVASSVAADWPLIAASDRAPTWVGWSAVERLGVAYGIDDLTLIKPGVGETTRVLLRRVPWRVLVRRGAGSDLDHVRLLAEQRQVPMDEVDDLPYSCVGLIHPRFTRGATGASGTAAR